MHMVLMEEAFPDILTDTAEEGQFESGQLILTLLLSFVSRFF